MRYMTAQVACRWNWTTFFRQAVSGLVEHPNGRTGDPVTVGDMQVQGTDTKDGVTPSLIMFNRTHLGAGRCRTQF